MALLLAQGLVVAGPHVFSNRFVQGTLAAVPGLPSSGAAGTSGTNIPDAPSAGQVAAVLQASLPLRDRRDHGKLTDHGLASVRGRLLARRSRLADKPSPLADAERFAAHRDTEFAAVFAFLWDPSVDPTNWRAEQTIRPAVVTPKVCGGNRTRHGADTQQGLASVVRTIHQRDINLTPLIATILRAANPSVPDALQRPPPSLKS